jgi:aminotransferase
VLVDIAEFIDRNAGKQFDDVYFAEWLTRRVGVAAVPGSSFFREPVRNYVRFHFAKRPATLDAAGERLLRLRELWATDHA